MVTNYLFPNRFKKIGWFLLIPTVILGLYTIITDFEPEFLDINVFAIFIDSIFQDDKYIIGFVNNNILNELLGVLMIVSSIFVAFSKEIDEDEFISKIRLDSLTWATYVNYVVLLLAFIFVYDIAFWWVMIFNMFTILIFFIIRFNWQVWKFKNSAKYEK
jgi:amino acid transporter